MKIATFNINGVKARLPALLDWLAEARPDVVAVQEIKSVDEAFPRAEIEDAGYNVVTHGQKGFNGVAILSRLPLEDVARGLPGDDGDDHARWIEATVVGARAVRVCGLYLPNGNPAPGPKYDYKLAWMERLRAPRRGAARGRGSRAARRRLQRHPPGRGLPRPEGLGRGRAVPPHHPRGLPPHRQPRADRRVSRRRRPHPAATPSGTTRPAPGRRTTASASTICCSRPRPPTASSPAASTSRSAAARSLPTTCPSGSNSTPDLNYVYISMS